MSCHTPCRDMLGASSSPRPRRSSHPQPLPTISAAQDVLRSHLLKIVIGVCRECEVAVRMRACGFMHALAMQLCAHGVAYRNLILAAAATRWCSSRVLSLEAPYEARPELWERTSSITAVVFMHASHARRRSTRPGDNAQEEQDSQQRLKVAGRVSVLSCSRCSIRMLRVPL